MDWLEAACFAGEYWEQCQAVDCFMLDRPEIKYNLPPDFDNSTAPRMNKPRTKWTPEEDQLLKTLCMRRRCNWNLIQRKFPSKSLAALQRRWANKLDPAINKSRWTHEEDELIVQLHTEIGGDWKAIASKLQGRPSTSVKNRYYGALKRRSPVQPFPIVEVEDDIIDSFFASTDVPFEDALKNLELESGSKELDRTKTERIAELQGRLNKVEELLLRTRSQIRDLETLISKQLDK